MSDAERAPDYETADISHPWWIASGVAGFIVFAIAVMGAIYLYYLPSAPEHAIQVSTFDQPRLQIDPSTDLAKLEAEQRAKLQHKGWVDRDAGVASIPIDAAMAVIAARKAEAYAPLPNAPDASAGTTRPPGAVAPAGRAPNPGGGPPAQGRGAM